MEKGSTTALCSLFHARLSFLKDFFPLSPASIFSGAAHYCFLFMLCCVFLREGGFPLLHSSPSSSRLQHLDPTPVHHKLQQYGSMTAKWETASCWEQWKEGKKLVGQLQPGIKLIKPPKVLRDITHGERGMLGTLLGWRMPEDSGDREDSQTYQGYS